jgi:hypothetical protein
MSVLINPICMEEQNEYAGIYCFLLLDEKENITDYRVAVIGVHTPKQSKKRVG